MNATVRYMTVGLWKENSYILEYNGEAWLIDPGDEFDKLDYFFGINNCIIKGIINTHGHFDHIGAVEDFRLKYNIPFYVHSKDKRVIHQANLLKRLTGDQSLLKTPKIDFNLDSIQEVFISGEQIQIFHTPGHSEGSMCFKFGNNLFSGDLFFIKEMGRFDSPGGNKDKIKQSLKFVLENFQGYHIFPGHGLPFILNKNIVKQLNKFL